MKAKASTTGDLELCSRGMLLLWRIPHVLDADSLGLLVGVVDGVEAVIKKLDMTSVHTSPLDSVGKSGHARKACSARNNSAALLQWSYARPGL